LTCTAVDVPCIKELKESNREDYDIFSKLLNTDVKF
jgi:hypothetical protein